MRVIVEVLDGAAAGHTVVLGPNQKCRVGRGEAADLVVANDGLLSRIHFVVECGDRSCRVRDLNSTNGTYVNGTRTVEAEVGPQDLVVAGSTSFTLRPVPEEEPAPQPSEAPVPAEPPARKNAGVSTVLNIKSPLPPESQK